MEAPLPLLRWGEEDIVEPGALRPCKGSADRLQSGLHAYQLCRHGPWLRKTKAHNRRARIAKCHHGDGTRRRVLDNVRQFRACCRIVTNRISWDGALRVYTRRSCARRTSKNDGNSRSTRSPPQSYVMRSEPYSLSGQPKGLPELPSTMILQTGFGRRAAPPAVLACPSPDAPSGQIWHPGCNRMPG